MRLAVLYTRLSGYIAACLEAYRVSANATLLIFAWPAEENAPFVDVSFLRLGEIRDRSKLDEQQIEQMLRSFRPDAVLVSGWIDHGYRRVCRHLKASGIPVVAGCDTQWKGSLRQHVAALVAPWHVHRFIDVLWVTGERQRQLARALGFSGARCWEGFYACDWQRFARRRSEIASGRPNSFLYVGRYVEEKGIRELAAAYRRYQVQVEKPWALVCAGKGELASLLAAVGAEDRGFVQPEHLPDLMHEAAAFVLPSRFEPWGVVVQEAAACELPLVVSDASGAAVHLLRDGYNGFLMTSGASDSLLSAMLRLHRLSASDLREFGRRSFELSCQYTPEIWAGTLNEGLAMLRSIMSA